MEAMSFDLAVCCAKNATCGNRVQHFMTKNTRDIEVIVLVVAVEWLPFEKLTTNLRRNSCRSIPPPICMVATVATYILCEFVTNFKIHIFTSASLERELCEATVLFFLHHMALLVLISKLAVESHT